MEIKEAVAAFKKLRLKSITFDFSCGGDSMGDTTVILNGLRKSDKESQEAKDLKEFIDNTIYDNVTFYEASNGVYMGEAGTVEIKLNETKDDFEYDKSSEAEYNERHTESRMINMSPKMIKFIKDNVSRIEGDSDMEIDIIFKKDVFLSDEDEGVVSEIEELLRNEMDNFEPEEINEDLNDWRGLEVDKIEVKKSALKVKFTVEYTKYETADW